MIMMNTPCCICNGESCLVIPSIGSPQHVCMLHYYTTGAHRSSNSNSGKNSLLVNSSRMEKQLPQVQEIFAEAFIELQKDIGEESARSFQLTASADDPLALLLDDRATSQPSFRKQKKNYFHQQKSTTCIDDLMDGGFLRETPIPERYRKLQSPKKLNEYAEHASSQCNNNNSSAPLISQNKRLLPMSNATTSTTLPTNQIKKKPPINLWNQVLDSNDDSTNIIMSKKKKKTKEKWEVLEKEMTRDITSEGYASTKICKCGSKDVNIEGRVNSRNNDMTKGAVWGVKDRSELVIERLHCQTCGRTWNEE